MSNDRRKEWKGTVHEVDEEQCTGKGDCVVLHHTLLKLQDQDWESWIIFTGVIAVVRVKAGGEHVQERAGREAESSSIENEKEQCLEMFYNFAM